MAGQRRPGKKGEFVEQRGSGVWCVCACVLEVVRSVFARGLLVRTLAPICWPQTRGG
jgi:hypothetical protein